MRNCFDEGTLQALFDRELPANSAAEVTAHLNTCSRCAEAMRALEPESSILDEALNAEFGAAIPSERLRERLDVAVAGLRATSAPRARQSRWYSIQSFFASLRPLAYASMAATVLLAVLFVVIYLKREKTAPVTARVNTPAVAPIAPQASPKPTTVPVASKPAQTFAPQAPRSNRRSRAAEPDATSLSWQEHQYERAIAKLNEAIRTQPPLRPSLLVEYEYNLALIDNAIANTRDVARKNPKDPQATQFMLAAYQSKVDLMNQIADARVLER